VSDAVFGPKKPATIHAANSLLGEIRQVAVTNLLYDSPWRRKDGSQLKLADFVAEVG
jgi:hypothetical protein